MSIDDKKYWNSFYSKNIKINKPSNFANLIKKKFLKKNFNILELGTGNGRDLFYLSKYSNSVTGIDQSNSAIIENKYKLKKLDLNNIEFINLNITKLLSIKNKDKFDFIYARFFIHSIDLKKENLLLKNILKLNKKKLHVAFEFRTIKDTLMNKGKKISKYERYTDHYRRFIDPDEFENKIKLLGYKVIYNKSGINFSKTKYDNPHLCRIVFKKK